MSNDPYTVYREFDAELVDDFLTFQNKLFAEGELSKKMKYLIAVALGAFNTSEGGVRAYSRDALQAGATWGEIKEALRVAYYIGHASPFWTVVRSFGEEHPEQK